MVYELLVGHPPFQGGPGQVMRQHYMMSPPIPSTLNPRLPPALDVVLMRALAKQPDERFPSVTMFAQAFEEAAQSRGELHATLAISKTEAIAGATRLLMLPGGRRISVTVPAGVSKGTILRLEGQGLPYYTGGPAGSLVLTISISAEAGLLLLPQESTEPTVTVSMPDAELLIIEAPRVSPAGPEAASDVVPTVPVPEESQSTSIAFGSNATSLPTELATPEHQTSLPADMARSSTPSALRPESFAPVVSAKRSISRRLVLLGLAGLVIVALGSGIAWLTRSHPSLTAPTGTPPTVPVGIIIEFPVPTANSEPNVIAVGPDGNLWFTEFASNKIGRISTNGTVTEFPIPAGNSVPVAIAAGPDGNLWFTESNGNQIGRISTNGTITEFPVPTANSNPNLIAAGPDGNLWFTEGKGNQIGRVSTNGTITEFPVPTANSNPNGIIAGPDGNLWFTEFNGNKIGRVSTSGAITEFPVPTTIIHPNLIAAGPDGNLWFTEWSGNKIGRITSNGSMTEFSVPTANSGPSAIAAGPDGNLWFTESNGNQIGRISTNGTITEFPVPTANSNPNLIIAGPDGNLWFTEWSGNKIGRITSGK